MKVGYFSRVIKLKAAIDKWVPKKQVKSHRRPPWIARQINEKNDAETGKAL